MTRYEIAARHTDGRSFLIGYTPRKSRIGIVDATIDRGPAIAAALGFNTWDCWAWLPPTQQYARDGWTIGFTGRTQNTAKTEGELPRITAKPDPDAELRTVWTAKGVPPERQDALIQEIEAKARPGAWVGPWQIPA